MGAFFSVIVPVYGVEKYLVECIESILQQNYSNYELILIDDGSPDKCPEICDAYAQNYSNIKVIHKENGGLSDARNVGIHNARGKYLLFIDSDDMIVCDAFSNIESTIRKFKYPDVVFLEAQKLYPNGEIKAMGDGYIGSKINNQPHLDVLKFLSSMPKFPGSACTKAVKREIVTDGIYFERGLLSEDIEWSYRLFQKAKTYAYCPYKYYVYRQQREGSITYRVSEKKIESMLWTINKWGKKGDVNAMQSCINSFAAYQYMVMLFNLSCLYGDKNKYIKEARKVKWILSYAVSKKCKIVHYACNFFGIRITSQLLKIYRTFSDT